MLVHAKHAHNEGFSEILIVSEDTDILILGVFFSTEIPAIIYQKRTMKLRIRIVNLSFIKDVSSTDVAHALPALHAFTGCNSVSAFSGKRKLSALKLLKRSKEYQNTFKQLGDNLDVTEVLEKSLEMFVCELYGGKTSDISELRYLIFCAKSGGIGSNQLPPSRQSLHTHVLRACYQTYIWKHSLVAQQDVQPPKRIRMEAGVKCRCKNKCSIDICCCVSNHLPCTDMCKCKTYDNRNDELVYGESVELEDIDLYEDEF